jgi:hypothetical protein
VRIAVLVQTCLDKQPALLEVADDLVGSVAGR